MMSIGVKRVQVQLTLLVFLILLINMSNKQEKTEILISNKFYWIYLAGFFFIILQLINVFPFWFAPNDWGKAILFRIILSILIFLFFWQIIYKKIELSYLKSKIKSVFLPFCFLVALSVIYLLSTIFSVNWHFSLWGDPNRNGGFVNFVFYIIFAILTFLIVRRKDWQKILDFSIIIGILVCIIAFIQQLGVFSKYLIPFEYKPISVMGNPILLSLYLLLMTFLPFSFGIITKGQIKKIFYFFSVFLFLLVSIFLVQTRGAYLGIFVGFLFFLFCYPKKTKIKIYAGILLVITLLGMYSLKVYLDNNLYIYQKLPSLISGPLDRALSLFEGLKITKARTSVWQVSWNALKERSILGYGPENFMIAFDKYYDPSLPKIGQIAPGDELFEWFDRAHNFIFDVAITGGIPALIIYLSLFGVLIWQLQKTKKQNPENALISHSLQATFLGYLTALFSAFDSVSTYLVSFLLIGYSLHLISNSYLNSKFTNTKNRAVEKLYKYRVPMIFVLFAILVWFLWVGNIKPLYLNKEMNVALAYADIRTERSCGEGLNIVKKISPSVPNSIINNYLGQKSTFVIYRCNDKLKKYNPEDLIKQNIEILKKNIEKNPQYVTNWILAGEYTGVLIKEKNRLTENVFILTEETKKLKKEADYYFENALKLSPKRQLILKDWADVNTITEEYQKAEEKLKKCIDLNPSYARCYWYMALNKGYQKDYEGFKKFFTMAEERNYGIDLPESLQELVNMYIRNSDYNGLAEVYPKLIPLTSDPLERAQLHASLAATYKELGDIKKAREEVFKIFDIIPLLPKELQEGAKKDVELFLQILK